VLQQRGAISKLVQNSAVIQLLLLASSSSSSRSKSERERRETSQKCFLGEVLLVFWEGEWPSRSLCSVMYAAVVMA
jgi:hypothetical protein